jgi:hypothetical protein
MRGKSDRGDQIEGEQISEIRLNLMVALPASIRRIRAAAAFPERHRWAGIGFH